MDLVRTTERLEAARQRSCADLNTTDLTTPGLAIAAVAASVCIAPDLRGWLGAGLAVVMAAIAIIDAHRFLIPNELNAVAFALGLIHAAAQAPTRPIAGAPDAALRATSIALLFYGLRVGYRHFRGREGLGLGDVKLAAVAGVWLGWLAAPVAIEIAALAALTTYLVCRHALGQSMKL